MRDYILGGGDSTEVGDAEVTEEKRRVTTPRGASGFFQKHESEKDSENVRACAAWWYSQYGNAWFNPNKDLRALADEHGLTVSTRIDMTIRQMRRDDKPLFRQRGASYSPTPHGERYLKKTFGVTKGTGTPPVEES
jgi:hypothetical protein